MGRKFSSSGALNCDCHDSKDCPDRCLFAVMLLNPLLENGHTKFFAVRRKVKCFAMTALKVM